MDVQKQAQEIFQKGFVMLVPMILVGGAFATAVWRMMTDVSFAPNSMKGFMVLVALQLLPLALLKIKTWICADRVSLVPLALIKTLMMHVFLQVLRLTCHAFSRYNGDSDMQLEQFMNLVAFLVLLYLLHTEYDMPMGTADQLKATLLKISTQHQDVISLIVGACVTGFGTEYIYPSTIDGSLGPRHVLISISNFMEILSFIPAVQAVWMETGVETYTPGTSVHDAERRKVRIFFAFLLTFYLWDDIIYCILEGEIAEAVVSKCAHFFMLLDFAGFFVLKVGAQPKFVEEMLPSVVQDATQPVLPQRDEAMQGLLHEEDEDDFM